MPGKKINTCEDFIKEALTLAYGDRENWTEDGWNDRIKERFETNRNLYNFRIREITEESILGATDNYFGLIKAMNQLDRIIETESDPVKKTMAMSLRHVAYPKCKTIIENNTLEHIKSFYDEIIRDNKVSKKAADDFKARIDKSNAATSGSAKKAQNGVDPNEMHFNEIPSGEQLVVLTTLIGSFMDNNICLNGDGSVRRENQPMKEILDEVNKCADKLMKNARGDFFSGFSAEDDTEKADLSALKSLYKNLDAEKKAAYATDVAGFNNLASYANMDITPNVDSLALNLDKSPVVTTTAESFVRNHTSDTLTFAEIEWGESNVDYMIEGLYTADELKELKKAGIDPAMGILVDGKPIDFSARNDSMLKSAKLKCEIVSKAIQGSKLDAVKIVPDGNGGYKNGKVVPVKTDLSMKTERRSIWTILKELFGFAFSFKDRVKKANNEKRDYQIDPENARTLSSAKRAVESMQLRDISDDSLRYNNKLDIDFFGDIYKSNGSDEDKQEAIFNGIMKDSYYTSMRNSRVPILSTLGRVPSRVDLAVIYGMTKGHTFEEMIADTAEGKTLRKQVGKEFVDIFKVCSLEEFAKKHELDAKSPETRDVYNTFILEKIEDVEKMLTKDCETFVTLPLDIPDPSNHAEYMSKYYKLSRFLSISKDIDQAFKPLEENRITPTKAVYEKEKTDTKPLSYSENKAKQVFGRTSAVYNHISSMIEPFMKIGFPVSFYTDYLKSDTYIDPKDITESSIDVDMAAVSKSALSYIQKSTKGMNTIADLNNNKELCNNIIAVAFSCKSAVPDKSLDLFNKEANLYIPSENPDFTPIIVEPEKKQITAFDQIIDYSNFYTMSADIAHGFEIALDKYDKIISEDAKNLSLSERVEAIKAAQKAGLDILAEEEKKADDKGKQADAAEKQADAKERVSFTELTEEKAHLTEKPKEAAAKEMSHNMGGIGK